MMFAMAYGFLLFWILTYPLWNIRYYRGKQRNYIRNSFLKAMGLLFIWGFSFAVIYLFTGVSPGILPDYLRFSVYVIDVIFPVAGLFFLFESREMVISMYRSFRGLDKEVNEAHPYFRIFLYLIRLYSVFLIIYGPLKAIRTLRG